VAPSLVSPVLVGRQEELGLLRNSLDRAVAGEQATVLVGGEAGVGKSRLVHDLIDQARQSGVRALVGGCVELDGGGIPFAPLVEMIRGFAAELEPTDLDDVLGGAREEIARLVPELEDAAPGASGDDRGPSRVLELMLGMIGRFADVAPLMLVFEDVQWADRSTLDLLALLIARASGRRLLVVLTARSDELHRAHPFRRMAAHREQQRLAERLELERLGPQDVAAQIEAIVGERPDGELIEFIAERSEGIPLFVEELLGAVRDGRMDHDYLPPSLRDVLLARAELLSPSAQHVLRVVSAAGRWVPDGLLARVAKLPAPELNAGLREAVEQQLLVVDATGRGFGFRHELARAAIHEDLLPGERAQLHQTYAEAIEDTPELAGSDLDVSSMLAYHWLAAHDLPRALPASVRAGRAAAEAYAPSAAQRHYELAPSSFGARYPTPNSVPASITPSCSRRRHPRPRVPGLLIARWRSSTRRSGRSPTTEMPNLEPRCSFAEGSCSSTWGETKRACRSSRRRSDCYRPTRRARPAPEYSASTHARWRA
jgi:predicted ATPase